MGPVPLEAGDEGMVGRIAEIAVLPGGVQHGMDPFQCLINQYLVIQDIGQGQQAVDPVGAPLPGVAVPAEPGVVVPDDRRIQAVEMCVAASGARLKTGSWARRKMPGDNTRETTAANGIMKERMDFIKGNTFLQK